MAGGGRPQRERPQPARCALDRDARSIDPRARSAAPFVSLEALGFVVFFVFDFSLLDARDRSIVARSAPVPRSIRSSRVHHPPSSPPRRSPGSKRDRRRRRRCSPRARGATRARRTPRGPPRRPSPAADAME
eukprot:31276-Pelagococcus_subviridis.AAC.7